MLLAVVSSVGCEGRLGAGCVKIVPFEGCAVGRGTMEDGLGLTCTLALLRRVPMFDVLLFPSSDVPLVGLEMVGADEWREEFCTGVLLNGCGTEGLDSGTVLVLFALLDVNLRAKPLNPLGGGVATVVVSA